MMRAYGIDAFPAPLPKMCTTAVHFGSEFWRWSYLIVRPESEGGNAGRFAQVCHAAGQSIENLAVSADALNAPR